MPINISLSINYSQALPSNRLEIFKHFRLLKGNFIISCLAALTARNALHFPRNSSAIGAEYLGDKGVPLVWLHTSRAYIHSLGIMSIKSLGCMVLRPVIAWNELKTRGICLTKHCLENLTCQSCLCPYIFCLPPTMLTRSRTCREKQSVANQERALLPGYIHTSAVMGKSGHGPWPFFHAM